MVILLCLFLVGVFCFVEIIIFVNFIYYVINGLYYKIKIFRFLVILIVLDLLYKLECVIKFCLDILGCINIIIFKMFGVWYYNRIYDILIGRNCV